MKNLQIVLAGAALAFVAPAALAQMQYSAPPPAQERKIEAPTSQLPRMTVSESYICSGIITRISRRL